MVTRPLLLFFTCVLLCFSLIIDKVDAADVNPAITLLGSNETVYRGDSVIIELESVGISDPLDTAPLFQGADLLRETRGTRIAVINERVVEMKLRRMELIPRHEGRVTFGPVTGTSSRGPVTSNTIVIEVQPPPESNWEPAPDDLQIEVKLTTGDGASMINLPDSVQASDSVSQPFVGQHIIADIELRHRNPIADEQVTLPDFDGFDILEQYVERRTVDTRESDNSWRITAWRYHLFAQRSGALSVGPVSWKGTSIRSRTQRSSFDRRSPSHSLHIKPAAGSAKWWLPASEVTLKDHWSMDPRNLTAGDEILRTITISARDVLASHLPDIIPPESRALTTTPISQTRSQQLTGNDITATAIFEFRMIAQSPIPVFLDTVRVPWFSTMDSQSREAIIPARRINVGLPDRADLLASIALEDSWSDRILLRLEGSTAQWLPWHISLALLSLVAAWLCSLELRHWLRERRRTKQGIDSTVLPEL